MDSKPISINDEQEPNSGMVTSRSVNIKDHLLLPAGLYKIKLMDDKIENQTDDTTAVSSENKFIGARERSGSYTR